jgi:glycosyltransferase involved in cell wall biosynthesis
MKLMQLLKEAIDQSQYQSKYDKWELGLIKAWGQLLYLSYHNLPNTILEAMSCGLPCVAFDCYGMKEIISHKKNGYLAEPYSVEDFKDGINYVLLNNNKFLFNKEILV